jgi:RimJ/RimL family protein N-acetyltransferase
VHGLGGRSEHHAAGPATVRLVTVVAAEGPLRWTARRDGRVVGELRVLVRPDQRCCLYLREGTLDTTRPLLDVALEALDQDLYVEVDEADDDLQQELAARGFIVNRREHHYLLPTDPARNGLANAAVPAGFSLVSAAEAGVDLLCELDETLRQDVPGSEGWRNDPRQFAEQTFDDLAFDPATYLVAVDDRTGRYAGLVRVWNNPDTPRLGLIGTTRPYRRRGLASALLARAFGVLHDRGQPQATCEVDRANAASNALMTRLGARRTGGTVELLRRR